MIKKAVWVSFDLGVSGDYEGMYTWLANHGALECGDSVALVQYEFKAKLLEELKRDLAKTVELRKKSRVYVIYRGEKGTAQGRFLFGARKQAPWTGFGLSQEVAPDEL